MSSRAWRAIAGLVFALSPSLYASPYNVYGAGSRGAAMGGAINADATDGFATFYNPSGLAFGEEALIQGEFLGLVPTLNVDRQNQNSTVEEVIPGNDFGINLGLRLPIVKGKLALGTALYIPAATKLLSAQSLDPVAPQFYMYQSLHDRFLLIPALSYRPVPQIAIGAGVNISTKLDAQFNSTIIAIDPNTGDAILTRDLVSDAKVVASPIVGVTLQPVEILKLGFTFRQKSDGQLNLDSIVQTEDPNLADLNLSLRTNLFFTPNQLSFGAALDVTPQVRVAAGVDVDFWSQALNPETLVATVVNVNGSEALQLETAEVELNFSNVAVPRVGVEVAPIDPVRLRAGYFFRKSHIPDQNGPQSNFLDNDVHALSVGGMFSVPNNATVAKMPFQLEATYQLQAMVFRTVGKEDPDDPVGNIGFGGAVHTIFFSLGQKF
jgi:long-chain fatty acid transport protein